MCVKWLGINEKDFMKLIITILFIIISFSVLGQKERARDIGIPFAGVTGTYNAITDVAGVSVGHSTVIKGEGENILGKGPVRTGVTVIFPSGKKRKPLFANWYALNGNGEMTGTKWISESGFLETPIFITNTFSVGEVQQAALKWMVDSQWASKDWWWAFPVVAETYDGFLNDIYGFHVKEKHVLEAIKNASSTNVTEGNVGGGTGMMSFGYKSGIGTSSRILEFPKNQYTVGVLVQSNFGSKHRFTVAGIPVGKEMEGILEPEFNGAPQSSREEGDGSIIVVMATDVPLLPFQLKRVTERISLAIGKLGGIGSNGSGDIFLAFSTANKDAYADESTSTLTMMSNSWMNDIFEATIQAVEEAVINSMIAAETMEGINFNRVHALPKKELKEILKRHKN